MRITPVAAALPAPVRGNRCKRAQEIFQPCRSTKKRCLFTFLMRAGRLSASFASNGLPYPETNVVKFYRKRLNTFDKNSFETIFIPSVLGEPPLLNLNDSISFFESSDFEECRTGLRVLFRRFPNELRVWDAFAAFLNSRKAEQIPREFAYYLAHIPWHGDIFAVGEMPTKITEEYARKLFQKFGKDEILNLVSLVDENGFDRGTVGQSVEAVISAIEDSRNLLKDIITDSNIPLAKRETAVAILAFRDAKAARPLLKMLTTEGSNYAHALLECLDEVGQINPY